MSNLKELSERLSGTLGLKNAPIGIAFSDEAPTGLPFFDGQVPPPSADGRTGKVSAGCVFWMEAATKSFRTAPQDHFNCSVGSVTHGLKTLEEVMGNEDVTSLLECEWVTPDEALALPVVQERPHHISYGPLAEIPVDPDVVLIRVNAFQAMVIQDAFVDLRVEGKPQCHIVPIAKEQNQIALSTGCMLSRLRTGMSPEEMTCTIPSSRLEEVVAALEARKSANAAVGQYATQDMRRFG